jgi:hypothetical protein
MTSSKPIVVILLVFQIGLFARTVRAQDPPGTAFITGCKSGSSIPGYKHPGIAIRAYAHFACGSSVYIWNAGAKAALVQQETTVAYIASKYVLDAGTGREESPVAVRTFLQGLAEGLQWRDSSVISARRELVRSCLATRGCRVDAWSHLAWTRIKRPSQLAESPDATLRFFAGGTYYSAFVVSPPVRFRDRPLPSLKSPVLLLAGGGLSLAIVDRACYTLRTDGKWAAAGASAGQSTAAMQ